MRREELQGERPLELEVLRFIDDPHAAVSEFVKILYLPATTRPGL